MYTRILAGVGAWLLGAGAATGGSLLAVSLIGQGIVDSHGQQLTTAAVNRALASEAAEQTASPQAPTGTPSAARTPARRPARSPARIPDSPAPPSSPAPAPTDSGQPGGTVLSSQGGTVVAGCSQAGAYLVSWSPQQGYEVSGVVRGPATAARVSFESQGSSVTMVVTCSGGIPSARSYVRGGGGDE